MSTENNNLFTDFETLRKSGVSSAEKYLASEPLSGLTDTISPRLEGLIPEPTDDLFDKMWASCDSLDNSLNNAPATGLNGRTAFQPISPDAFMKPVTVLEGRGSAPIFDDVFPEQNRSSWTSPQPAQNADSDEIEYFEQLWKSGDFPKKEKCKEQILWESGLQNPELTQASSEDILNRTIDNVDIPQLLEIKTESKNKVEGQKTESQNNPELPSANSEIASNQPRNDSNAVSKAESAKSGSGWTLSLISCLTALIVGLFIFGWNMLPAYLVQYQIQQATGLSLHLKKVSQDYRSGVTSVESVQAFDSAQRPFFETGHAVFSSLPYYIGDNQQMKWAMVEGIRFAPTPSYVSSVCASLSNNDFNKALKCVGKELDDSQIDLLVKNSVSTISTPYEQAIRRAEKEVKDITKQIQVLQERLLASGEEATDADKAQATSYEQRMKMALSNMSIEESQYNQRNTALLDSLHRKGDESRAESNVPALTNGAVTEYLFGQDYTEFTGQLLYEIRQFCRWLPADLEKALGPVDKLDPSALSFRRIATQEQLAVGQIRLTGQTQFMNQSVPFSAVISNYSTLPNGKPLTLDVAFGADQSARLHLEARRGKERTEIKVEFASSNVNPGTQFGQDDGLRVKLTPDQKTPFVQTRSVRFIVADGRIQGEYAMAQTAPSISIGVKGVSSEENAAKLEELVQTLEKITLNGTISGQYAKPEFHISSNLESWGHTVLALAAKEYDARMDIYRTAIEKKSEELIDSEQKRIGKIAEVVRVSANGNALLLNQLCSGVVDSQIVVNQSSSDAADKDMTEAPALEIKEETPESAAVAGSEDESTLPSLEELKTEENVAQTDVSEDMAFPELPVPEPETAQPSTQIASGDAVLGELPVIQDVNEISQTETNSNAVDSTLSEVEELPVLPDIEDLLPHETQEEKTENHADPQFSSVMELPPLEDLAPQKDVPMTAPTELQATPNAAMEITSPGVNYQSPEMEFPDEAPMEEALPEVQSEQSGDAIPLVAPNTVTKVHRVTPPSLPIVIED